jgi:threonine/homoserine/homoserine lactone efflux protein
LLAVDSLVAYVSFTALLVLTPGATTAVIVRNTLTGGRPAGFAAAIGAALGNACHATAAGFGLAVIFARWPVALMALRVGGAAYLGWLGARSVYRVIRYPDGGLRLGNPASTQDPATPPPNHRGSFRQGLLVNLLNPAIATFYLIVVPSFLPATAPGGFFVLLAAVHVFMALACHLTWAIGLDRIRRLFLAPRPRRALEGATGVALVLLALRVLVR